MRRRTAPRRRTGTVPQRLLVILALLLCSVSLAAPARAAQTIGFPTFTGPAIPAPPAVPMP